MDPTEPSHRIYILLSEDRFQAEVFSTKLSESSMLLEAVKGGYISKDGKVRLLKKLKVGKFTMSETKIRCDWCKSSEIYMKYHDEEWGKPEFDSLKLFEKICLEGQQAGLSWITVLKKREAYRQAFHQFNPEKIAKMGEEEIDLLMQNTSLIHHRAKLEAIIKMRKLISQCSKMAKTSVGLFGLCELSAAN